MKMGRKARVFLVNVRPEEAKQYSHYSKKTFRATLEQIKSVPKHSIIIIEDIVSLSKKEELCLRGLLNYYCHHRQLKLYAVTHTIHKNSIFSLLPLFHYLIFTGSASNLPVVRYVFSYFKIEPTISLSWLDCFDKKPTAQVKYLVFDCSKMSFYECPDIYTRSSFREANSQLQAVRARDESAQGQTIEERFKLLLAGSNLPEHYVALVSLLAAFLPARLIQKGDLSIGFKVRGSKNNIKRIGLVDYLVCLLTPSMKPDPYQLALHAYIKEQCLIPRHLILNPWLR